jgi:transketolase
VQLSTTVEEVDTEDVAAKYRAWEWNVISIDGGDAEQIRQALREANSETRRPTLIIGKTVMGLGARNEAGESFENKVSTHGQPLSAAGASIDNTIRNLGGDPASPFAIFPESKALYDARREELTAWAASQHEAERKWRASNAELAAKLDQFFSGRIPAIDYDAIDPGTGAATRNASAAVLGVFGQQVENMIVSSADLSNSDKTDGFLKKTRSFARGDFGGQFFQAGVSELTMACVMNGMALHGGVIPVCGTFFVFSDYMKPAIRIAALQRLHVVYVWSHDSFRVGEDGPTHQPIEQEAQIRLLEQLRNHDGDRSVIVLRPADGAETIEAWRYAVEADRPVALILSRQNVKDLPALGVPGSGSRRADAKQLTRGAYVVADSTTPDVVMIASGSEVATLVEGAELLAADGVKVRIVSAPSEGLFRDQDAGYQRDIIPAGIPRYGLTSGLPLTLRGLVGEGGFIHGLDHFGYSAPYKVLDEKFGFSGENVRTQVKALLNK